MKFSNGEVFLFLHLVEVGGHPDTAPCPPPAVPAPPASILYVSNSVAPDMDELTHNVLEWGGSRMEWTWRTAVAGAATASAVTLPPVDSASLARSCTNKRCHTRHASSGQSHHSSASVPAPPPPRIKGWW